MADYERKNGKLQCGKTSSETAKGPSAAPQKSTLCDLHTLPGDEYISMYPDQVKGVQNHCELLESGRTASDAQCQRPLMINTDTTVDRRVVMVDLKELQDAGNEHPLKVADVHAQNDLATQAGDALSADTKTSSKVCGGARPRKKECAAERKTSSSPRSVEAAEPKSSRQLESVNGGYGARQVKANDAASPASTISEEARVLNSKGGGAADTPFGASLNLQQLSQSSTSATPPPSECSSDESPFSSPDVTDVAAPISGRPFRQAAAPSTSVASNANSGNGSTRAKKPGDARSAKSGDSPLRNEDEKHASYSESFELSNNARISSASDWPSTSRPEAQATWTTPTQDMKSKQSGARHGQPPGSGCVMTTTGHCQKAAERSSATGETQKAPTGSREMSTSPGDASRSAAQSHLHCELPCTSAHPSHLSPAPFTPSPTTSDWQCPPPGRLQVEMGTLQGLRIVEARECQEMQDDGARTQTGTDCAQQSRSSNHRGPTGTTDGASGDTTTHHFETVSSGVVDGLSLSRGLPVEKKQTAAFPTDTQQCSWTQPQQSVRAAGPFELAPFSCVAGSAPNGPTASEGLSSIPLQHTMSPQVFSSYESPFIVPPPLPCKRVTDALCFPNAEAYGKTVDRLSTTIDCFTKADRKPSTEANAVYGDLEGLSSEPLPQQPLQHSNAAILAHHMAGGLESLRGRGRHTDRNGGSQPPVCNVPSAGYTHRGDGNSAEVGGPSWSSMRTTGLMADHGDNGFTPASIAPSGACPGISCKGESEDGGYQRRTPLDSVPCHMQSKPFVPVATNVLNRGKGDIRSPLGTSVQHTQTPAEIKEETSLLSPHFQKRESLESQDMEPPVSAGLPWLSCPGSGTPGCGHNVDSESPISETRDPFFQRGIYRDSLQEKQDSQPWQNATIDEAGDITYSTSKCYYAVRSPTSSIWSPTALLTAEGSSLCSSRFGGSGASETCHPKHSTSCSNTTAAKYLTCRTHERSSGLMPQERQQRNSLMVEESRSVGDCCLARGTLTSNAVVELPRTVSGSNSGMLWSITVPPVSLLLTLPLNLPYGKIVKFGGPTVLPQNAGLLPPPPPTSEPVLADNDSQTPTRGLGHARPPLTPRTLGAKKSYYCFSPALHPGAHTLFSHAGGICDTFAASLHLELAILYVPPPLLEAVASIFQALAPRLPRLASPLRLECGGLEERNAPGRFGGKVLTVSCAVEDQQERYKFQQMQEFLMLFQNKVEHLLREYTLQQQLLLGRKPATSGQHRQGNGGSLAPGKKHNIWRYAMSCLPTNLGNQRQLASSSEISQGNASLKSGSLDESISQPAAGTLAKVHARTGDSLTFTSSNSVGGSSGGGFLDLTIRAFEAKALDKATKEYAKRLVVKDVCVSEIRLVTTRGIEDKTCEIDPRFPQYSIGTRPIVLGTDGRLCRHSLVDVHALPDVWEVRLRPGNTREEQKRLVERCVHACIENKPLEVRNEALKAATDAGVMLWLNGKMPPPPPPALQGEVQQGAPQEQYQKEQRRQEATRAEVGYSSRDLQSQQSGSRRCGIPSSRDDGLLDSRDSTRPSTPARNAVKQMCNLPPLSCSRQSVHRPLLSSQDEDPLDKLLRFTLNSSNEGSTLLAENSDDSLLSKRDADQRQAADVAAAAPCSYQENQRSNSAAFSALSHSLFPERGYRADALSRSVGTSRSPDVEVVLAPLRCGGADRQRGEEQQVSDGMQGQTRPWQQRDHETDLQDSLAAALSALPPGLDLFSRGPASRAAMLDARHRLSPVLPQTAAREHVVAHSSLRQTQALLEVLATGWNQQQQREEVVEGASKDHGGKDSSAAAEEEHKQCADELGMSLCDSGLQHVPAAVQYFQQLQHALNSESAQSRPSECPAAAETSRLLNELLSLPTWSSLTTPPAQPYEEKQFQQEWQGTVDGNRSLTPRGGNGSACDATLDTSSAAAISAARALLTRARSVAGFAELLGSQDASGVVEEVTAATLVQSTPSGALSPDREDIQTALCNLSGIDTDCNDNSSRHYSSNSTAVPISSRMQRSTLAQETAANGNAVSCASQHASTDASTSYPDPFRAAPALARSTLEKGNNPDLFIIRDVKADMREAGRAAGSNWDRSLDGILLSSSLGLGLGESTSIPEELLRHKHLLQVSCEAACETTDTHALKEPQQATAPQLPHISQHVRSRVAPLQQGNNVLQHQRLPQQLPHDQQMVIQRTGTGQETAAGDSSNSHALQLLHSDFKPSGKNILQDFLGGDLMQQCRF